MRTIAGIALVMAACTSTPTTDQAKTAYSALSNELVAAQIRAVTQLEAATATRGVQPLDATLTCDLGGAITFSGTLDDSAPETQTTFDLQAALSDCLDQTLDQPREEARVAGNVHWTSTVNGGDVATAMQGAIDYSDSSGAWSCELDDVVESDVTLHVAGTFCGYSMRDDLNLGY